MASKLPTECLVEILEILNADYTLYPCVFVSREWCNASMPLLWSDPWKHIYEYYEEEDDNELSELLISTYISRLSEDDRNVLIDSGVTLTDWMKKRTCFDYPSFLRNLNFNDISHGVEKYVFKNVGRCDSVLINFLVEKIGCLLMTRIKRLDYLGFVDRFEQVPNVDYSSYVLKDFKENSALGYIRKFVCRGDTRSDFLYALAKFCKLIEELEFHDIFEDNDALACLIRSQKSLRSFRLEVSSKSPENFEITNIQNAFQGIKTLIDLQTNKKLLPLKLFTKCTGLQKLHLDSKNDDIQDMEEFVKHKFPDLKDLKIRVKNLCSIQISKLINTTKCLDRLCIYGKIEDPENAFIFRDSLINKCANLYSLSLAFQLIENFIPPLPSFFKTFKCLHFLDLMLSASADQRNIGEELIEAAPHISKQLCYIHLPKNWRCDKVSKKKFFDVLKRKNLSIFLHV